MTIADELLLQVADNELLRGARPQTIEFVCARLQLRRCAPGQLVLGQSDPGQHVFLVLQGRVRVTLHTASGREVAFRDLGSGEIAAIDGGPRSASVLALERSCLGVLPPTAFREAIQRDPAVADNVLHKLARLVRSLTERVYEFSLPVATRVGHELLRLCAQAGGNGPVVLAPPPRHAEIASRVSTHREAVSRIFAQLQREGLLLRRPGALVVPDVAKLRSWLAEPEDAEC